ncbi:MAG: leucine-rich repeat domain-containing protein [Clostridiales bacterium]|nr:leucine-rich repeat domain-containing protein [Clostridiales bacterium]
MKKIFSVIITSVLLALNLCFFTACGGGEDVSPEYSETYTFNENMHWRNQLNGNGRTDVGSHVNDSGKCKVCNYYYDASEFLSFVKVSYNGETYYAVNKFEGEKRGAYKHIEIPAYHQKLGDTAPIPVIAINAYIFSPTKNLGIEKIYSIKLNEGLKFIGNGAFSNTMLKEAVIPNSVTGGINGIGGVTFDEEGNQVGVGKFQYWPSSTAGLYNVFGGCSSLKRVVIGNGLHKIEGYLFSSCSQLEEVILGEGINKIAQRAFYECKSLKQIVLPASLVSIPEGSIYTSAADEYQALTRIFEYTNDIYLNITKEEYKKLVIRKVKRGYSYRLSA